MTAPRTGRGLDVSALPSYAFGPRGPMWWGTLGLVAIEGTVFAIAVVSYFYLRTLADSWPLGTPPPELLWGTVNVGIMLASVVPNHFAKQAARAHDLRRVRAWMLVCLAFGLAFLGVRVLEFGNLNCGWDTNAYGSVVWLLLGLHTAHLLTDWLDTAVLAVLMHTGPLEGKRFVDVAENAEYWDFVVLSWLPIYAVIYWAARF